MGKVESMIPCIKAELWKCSTGAASTSCWPCCFCVPPLFMLYSYGPSFKPGAGISVTMVVGMLACAPCWCNLWMAARRIP